MKKEEFIRIRVAGWQKKYISLQAEKAHKSLSEYVRGAAMDKDVTVIDGMMLFFRGSKCSSFAGASVKSCRAVSSAGVLS